MDPLLHVHRVGAGLEVLAHLVLVAGLRVQHVPLPGPVVGALGLRRGRLLEELVLVEHLGRIGSAWLDARPRRRIAFVAASTIASATVASATSVSATRVGLGRWPRRWRCRRRWVGSVLIMQLGSGRGSGGRRGLGCGRGVEQSSKIASPNSRSMPKMKSVSTTMAMSTMTARRKRLLAGRPGRLAQLGEDLLDELPERGAGFLGRPWQSAGDARGVARARRRHRPARASASRASVLDSLPWTHL